MIAVRKVADLACRPQGDGLPGNDAAGPSGCVIVVWLRIWATERIIGAWGAKAVDRLLRFVALSIGLHVFLAPFTYNWGTTTSAAGPAPWTGPIHRPRRQRRLTPAGTGGGQLRAA